MAELSKLGRYELRSVLGKGAMGVVYEGFDPVLNRRVAVKTILKSIALDAGTQRDYSARFVREAQAVARLNHPHIVQVHDFGEHEDIAYLVMEFIQGRELRAYFDENERFSIADAARIMGELLDALDFAHEAGVIHRDVKPANVMLDAQQRVKLADFGVARVQDRDLSAAGTMVGTPAFMSPEQISGGKIDRRSDVFSAGVVLYQLLTGEQPFKGEGAWTVVKHIMQEDPQPPSALVTNISPAYDALVDKALAKNPAERFASAREFALALRATVAGGAPVIVAPKSRAKPDARTSDAELEFWRTIQNSGDAAELEYYLERFPAGTYAQLARHKLAKLQEVSALDPQATVAIGGPRAAWKTSYAARVAAVAVVIAVGIGGYLLLGRTPAPVAQAPETPRAELSAAEIDKIRKETEERIRREYADKSAAEQAAAAKAAGDKAVEEKQMALKAAAEKAAAEKSAAEKVAQEKQLAMRLEAERAAAEKSTSERLAAEKAAAERAAAARAAEEKLAAAKAAEARLAEAKAAEKAAEAAKAPAAVVAAVAPEGFTAGRYVFRLSTGSGGSFVCDGVGFEEETEFRASSSQGISGRNFSSLRVQGAKDGSLAASMVENSSRYGTGEVNLVGRATGTGYAGTYVRKGSFGGGNQVCEGQWTLVRRGSKEAERVAAPAKASPANIASAAREGVIPGRYALRLLAGDGLGMYCHMVDVNEDIDVQGEGQSIPGRGFTDLRIRGGQGGSISASLHGVVTRVSGDVTLAGGATANGYAGTYMWRYTNVTCEGRWTMVRKGG